MPLQFGLSFNLAAMISAMSRDLGRLADIAEELFFDLLPGGAEEMTHYPTGYFSRYDH